MEYIRRVIIESNDGTSMDDMDFTLEFYVLKSKKVRFGKNDLIHVTHQGESMYFVPIDSKLLGQGDVKCKATIVDIERRYVSGRRIIELTRMTGLTLGLNCPCGVTEYDCECYEEGYKLRFEAYEHIPIQDAVRIFYGAISTPISGYDHITAEMVKNFSSTDSMEHFPVGFNSGDNVVILVNEDIKGKAYKDSGFGKLVSFDEGILGANGQYVLVLDGINYRIYGEKMLVSGEIYVTIN